MISRVINGVEIEIDPLEGDAIYLLEGDANNLEDFEIETIISYIFLKGNSEYIPLFMTIELTNKCNYNCPFCYINTNDSKNTITSFYRFDDIKDDLAWLVNNGLLYCTITGGEPLLHPDFKKIYLYLKENGVLINLYTNLSLLKGELLDLILSYPPLKIETTMYAYSEQQYKEITGQSVFSSNDFKERVLLLKKHGINVICKTPLNLKTIQEFRNCQKWCQDNNVEYYYSENVFNTYNGEDMQHFSLSKTEQTKILQERIKEASLKDMTEFGNKETFNCGAGKFACFISFDYSLRPCMSFYEIEESIFKIEFNKIEVAFNKMLEFIKYYKGKQLSLCNGCNAKKICKVCVIDEIKYLNDRNDYQYKCRKYNNMISKIE